MQIEQIIVHRNPSKRVVVFCDASFMPVLNRGPKGCRFHCCFVFFSACLYIAFQLFLLILQTHPNIFSVDVKTISSALYASCPASCMLCPGTTPPLTPNRGSRRRKRIWCRQSVKVQNEKMAIETEGEHFVYCNVFVNRGLRVNDSHTNRGTTQ